MKKAAKFALVLYVVAATSISHANPKCSHRLASSGNDLLKSTNPVKMTVAKASNSNSGKESTRSGTK